jgi:hypothetical protein
MSGSLLSGFLAALLATMGGLPFDLAQAEPGQTRGATPADSSTPKPADKEIRLNGCIARDKSMPGQFTFLDNESGGKYRLTGKNLKKFVGQRVEIVGGPPGKSVTFRTGLWPSPNAAARAGALSPAQIAIANREGIADGSMPLPEFHVVSLRGLEGGCQ